MAEEIVECNMVKVEYRTYAHAALDSVLVTEIRLTRQQGFSQTTVIRVQRKDLSGGDVYTAFNWSPVEQIESDSL